MRKISRRFFLKTRSFPTPVKNRVAPNFCLWAGCTLLHTNVGLFAINVVSRHLLFANNVGRKVALIVGPAVSYCGPLQIAVDIHLQRSRHDFFSPCVFGKGKEHV